MKNEEIMRLVEPLVNKIKNASLLADWKIGDIIGVQLTKEGATIFHDKSNREKS